MGPGAGVADGAGAVRAARAQGAAGGEGRADRAGGAGSARPRGARISPADARARSAGRGRASAAGGRAGSGAALRHPQGVRRRVHRARGVGRRPRGSRLARFRRTPWRASRCAIRPAGRSSPGCSSSAPRPPRRGWPRRAGATPPRRPPPRVHRRRRPAGRADEADLLAPLLHRLHAQRGVGVGEPGRVQRAGACDGDAALSPSGARFAPVHSGPPADLLPGGLARRVSPRPDERLGVATVHRYLEDQPRLPEDLRRKVLQHVDELERTVRIRETQ